MVDVIAIVKEIGDVAEITTRNNKTVGLSSSKAMATSLQMLVYRHKSVTSSWWITQSFLFDSLYGESKQSSSAPLLTLSLRAKAFGLAISMVGGFPSSQTLYNFVLRQECPCPFSVLDLWLLALIFQRRML